MPGEHGLGEIQLPGEDADDLQRVVPEGGERPRGAAELCRQTLGVDGREPPARLERGDEPARRLEPERGRNRLLEEGARCDRRRAVVTSETGASVCEPVELREHERPGTTGDEHRRRVDDVLARGPEMDVVGRVLARGLA